MSRFLSLVVLLACPALLNACAPIEHDPITAHDLAALLPAFGKLPPDTPIAAAPGAGVRRIFHAIELTSIARNYSLDLATAEDVCFEWPMEAPDRDRMLEAMKTALPEPGVHIELLETSLYPAPRGRLEFRREDLGAPALPNSPAPVVWRGNIIYGANQRFAVWARVRVTAQVSRVIAVEPIRQGMIISTAQLRMESGTAFPVSGDTASRMEDVAGRIALRNITAGSEIHLGQIEEPPAIKRGEMVTVEVFSGAAHLAFSGRSESDGRMGDTISIRNPRSTRVFQARVSGKDRAVVDLRTPDTRN